MPSKQIRVLINGAKGRMGHLAAKAIAAHPALNHVGGASRQDDLAQVIANTEADVVVDLTEASAALTNAKTIIAANARPVIGTSGLQAETVAVIQQLCEEKSLGGIIAPNFSLGAIMMMRCAATIARQFQYAEIIEHHHEHKQDAPSGTAIKTAELIASAGHAAAPPMPSKENIAGSRGAVHQNIPIHAVRVPGSTAKQEVLFGAPGETLQITHHVIDRAAYMPGICLACERVMALQQCVYGLEHVMDA